MNEGDPYYPIPQAKSQGLKERYQQEARQLANVFFVGRLAEYQYLNMDTVVDHALGLVERLDLDMNHEKITGGYIG